MSTMCDFHKGVDRMIDRLGDESMANAHKVTEALDEKICDLVMDTRGTYILKFMQSLLEESTEHAIIHLAAAGMTSGFFLAYLGIIDVFGQEKADELLAHMMNLEEMK